MEEDLRFFLTKGDITGYKKIIDSVDINYTTKSGSSYLHYAIASSNYSEDIVIDLLKRGIDINKLDSNNRSPLECCCEYNRIYIAKLLLEKGANVNSIDRWGNNPLWRLPNCCRSSLRCSTVWRKSWTWRIIRSTSKPLLLSISDS